MPKEDVNTRFQELRERFEGSKPIDLEKQLDELQMQAYNCLDSLRKKPIVTKTDLIEFYRIQRDYCRLAAVLSEKRHEHQERDGYLNIARQYQRIIDMHSVAPV